MDCIAFLLKYDLKDPGLVRLAKIVHAADVEADIDSDPMARGLDKVVMQSSTTYMRALLPLLTTRATLPSDPWSPH